MLQRFIFAMQHIENSNYLAKSFATRRALASNKPLSPIYIVLTMIESAQRHIHHKSAAFMNGRARRGARRPSGHFHAIERGLQGPFGSRHSFDKRAKRSLGFHSGC